MINSLINFNKSGIECCICKEITLVRGILSVCKHYFCIECILKWEQKSNSCPLCRLEISTIAINYSKKMLKVLLKSKGKSQMKQFYKESVNGEYSYYK